jgi:benzoylformate decarboxylase
MNGIEAALEILAQAGVRHLFGNPGTTELPLNVALRTDTRFQYLFGLHEIPVMGMADGFAMASGQLAVVNLHVACGLGNAMGMLYNAFLEGTPLLVTTGDQDRRLAIGSPVLSGDLLAMARPCTKWAAQVTRLEDLPNLLRQAIQVARTPPTGPVFLSIPLDLQQALAADLDLRAPLRLDVQARPARAALETAARYLAEAQRPVILAGSRVTEANGVDALAALAELLGAPVFSEATPSHGRLPLAPTHPLSAGPLSPWAADVQSQLADYDTILAVGLNVMRWYIHQPIDQVFPPGARLIHLDSSAAEIGKNYPVDVGLWGDVQEGLSELRTMVPRLTSEAQAHQGQVRAQQIAEHHARQRQRVYEEVVAESAGSRFTAKALMYGLSRVLPPDIVVVEEAITTHQHLFEHLGMVRRAEHFFAQRGWSLGWGLGCALGVQLAWPERPVLALLGDGSALYGIQGLWSAAHHQLPVTLVIANNGQYRILKQCGDRLDLPELYEPDCPGVNLTQPAVDFVQLAAAFGVSARRVSTADELSQAVDESLRSERPQLIEASIVEA